MNTRPADETAEGTDTKWGYAVAGAIALGFAAVIQFALGGLSDDALENLPAFIVIPYTFAGKLGLTILLAVLGLALIVRDVLANRSVCGNQVDSASVATLKREAPAGASRRGAPSPDAEEMETGEPLPEEEQAAPARGKPRIRALPGRFDGRKSSDRERTGGPAPSSEPSPAKGGGAMVLSTEKYLDRNKQGGKSS